MFKILYVADYGERKKDTRRKQGFKGPPFGWENEYKEALLFHC